MRGSCKLGVIYVIGMNLCCVKYLQTTPGIRQNYNLLMDAVDKGVLTVLHRKYLFRGFPKSQVSRQTGRLPDWQLVNMKCVFFDEHLNFMLSVTINGR